MKRPLAIELFAGSFGWGAGLIAAGWRTVGFDIIHEEYHGPVPEHAQLVLQDILTLHGSQFKDAQLIVASPPCQKYSYMAMPWKRGKAMAAEIRVSLMKRWELNRLFRACFRIQREASEAAGRHIPMVVENVRGARPWVGEAAWNYGSFYLWGDVPALMPPTSHRKVLGFNFHQHAQTGLPGMCLQQAALNHLKTTGHALSRKAASAAIAKIPFDLAYHIGKTYLP